MIIKHAHIEQFRALKNVDFDLGSKITAVVGYNGTMKTTILGILSQTFTISKGHVMNGEKTIDGYNYHSQFKEKFKLSEKDRPGEHKWRLDLYDGVYKSDCFEAHSIPRDKTTNEIRFWSTEGKSGDTGYPQIPVYYISLKRVTPIGEEGKVTYVTELDKDEIDFLNREYKEIFSVTQKSNLQVDSFSTKNKHTASIHDEEHDALSISAGQDNLAKILLAVLSFRRLKNKYPDDYIGGVLLIDEIESTFHPIAQQMLIKRIYKYAKDYKIQFVFTTHSPSVIKSTFFDKYNSNEAQLLYLKKVGDNVHAFNNPSVEEVVAELSGVVIKKTKRISKLNVFCEDIVGRNIIKHFLSTYKNNYNIMSCSLGAEEYLELLRVKLNEIKNAVVIIDGDKNCSKITNKIKTLKADNVMFLPTKHCPEKMFYEYLMNLPDDAPIWNNALGGFDKNKCFMNYPTLLDRNADTQMFKKWFDSVKSNFGRGYAKLLNFWVADNPEMYEEFVKHFLEKYNSLARNHGIDILE